MALSGLLLVPGVATLWTAWRKFTAPVPPAPLPLSLAGAGALAVNMSCPIMLARYRRHSGSLTRAAFLSARNDVLANVAIVIAGLLTSYTRSAWPDLIVGLGIAFMNAGFSKRNLPKCTGGTPRHRSEVLMIANRWQNEVRPRSGRSRKALRKPCTTTLVHWESRVTDDERFGHMMLTYAARRFEHTAEGMQG